MTRDWWLNKGFDLLTPMSQSIDEQKNMPTLLIKTDLTFGIVQHSLY